MTPPEKTARESSNGHPAPVDSALYDREYFLSECEGYEEFISSEGQLLSRRLAMALGAVGAQPGMRALDIGCGRGESLIWLARRGVEAWGLDYSGEALCLAKLAVAGADKGSCLLVSSDAKELPFQAESFERVLMLDILEHLHPWELARALQEVHRVLKPTGKLIVHTAPNRWYYRFGYPLFRLSERLRGVDLPRDPRVRFRYHPRMHINEQSPLGLWRSLKGAGFQSRIWLADTQERWRGWGRGRALAGWAVTHMYPFKWAFCAGIFAVAWKRPSAALGQVRWGAPGDVLR